MRLSDHWKAHRYARLLVNAGILNRPSIGGQTITHWACGVCEQPQVSGSTAHGSLCEDCRRELIRDATPSAPEPAPAPTVEHVPLEPVPGLNVLNATERVCRCSGGWDGADRGCVRWVPVSRRDEWCNSCGHDRACHTGERG